MRIPKGPIAIVLIIVAIFAIAFGVAGLKTVSSGEKGVLIVWGEIKGIVHEGIHWVNPIGTNIVNINTQIQIYEANDLSTGTTDLQEVFSSIAVNYRVDELFVDEVYKNLRNDYERRVVKPNIEEALKATTKNFEASEMITLREDVKAQFKQSLTEALEGYHIIVDAVMMTDFQFSESFSAEIDAKSNSRTGSSNSIACLGENPIRSTTEDY